MFFKISFKKNQFIFFTPPKIILSKEIWSLFRHRQTYTSPLYIDHHQPKNLEIVGFSSFRKGVEGVMKGPELSDEVTTDQGANAFSQYIRE